MDRLLIESVFSDCRTYNAIVDVGGQLTPLVIGTLPLFLILAPQS
jgi:hypothetical protein